MAEARIEPTREQVQRLARVPEDGPIVMLNLLRFKERADGVDAEDGLSGAEAYGRYGKAAMTFLAQAGGRVLFSGAVQQSVIGPHDGEWDLVILVRYPSRAAFLRMIGDPGYLAIHRHRAAALADSRLVALDQLPG